VKFGQFGKISANFGVGSSKIGAEIKLRVFDRFLTNFSGKQNYCETFSKKIY
jgi:hypothetical protein